MLTLKWWLSNSLNFQKSGCDEGPVANVKHATLDMLPLAVADPFESPPNCSTTRFQQSCFKYFQSVKGFKTDDPDNIWHHVEANSTLQTSPDSRPWRSPEIHSALLEGPWKFQTSKASAARTLLLAVSMTVAMKPTAMITSVVPHFTAWTWALNLSRLSSLREKPKKPAGFYAGSCNLTVSHLGSSNWIALTSLKIS